MLASIAQRTARSILRALVILPNQLARIRRMARKCDLSKVVIPSNARDLGVFSVHARKNEN
jgi:hypothetical protein